MEEVCPTCGEVFDKGWFCSSAFHFPSRSLKQLLEEEIVKSIIENIQEVENELKANPEFWKEVARRSMENAPKITFEPPPPGIKC